MNRFAVSLCSLASVGLGTIALAGPLNPPDGAISSTGKTLSEVEPRIAINAANTPGDADSVYRIDASGSYYLTGNLTGVNGKRTIEIAANNVTIDLNGFTLRGVNGSLEAIGNDRTVSDLSISNGSIANYPDRGLNLTNVSGVTGARIERVSFHNCTTGGVQAGPQTHVESCTFINCSNALTATTGAIVRNCTFVGCDVQGVGVDAGSIVEGCTFRPDAAGTSIALLGAATARNCSVSGGATGIAAAANCLIEGNYIEETNQQGIWSQNGCRIVRNHLANMNLSGIRHDGNYAEIADNMVTNVRFGAGVDRGIYLFGSATRNAVHGNTVTDCDVGIEAAAGGNAIYANALSTNTSHFVLVAGNRVGPIVTGTLSPAINGSTGGSGMGSTDPFANVLY